MEPLPCKSSSSLHIGQFIDVSTYDQRRLSGNTWYKRYTHWWTASHCTALGGSFDAGLPSWGSGLGCSSSSLQYQPSANPLHDSLFVQRPPHVFLGCFPREVEDMLLCSHLVVHFRLSDYWLTIKFNFQTSLHNALQYQLSWLSFSSALLLVKIGLSFGIADHKIYNASCHLSSSKYFPAFPIYSHSSLGQSSELQQSTIEARVSFCSRFNNQLYHQSNCFGSCSIAIGWKQI